MVVSEPELPTGREAASPASAPRAGRRLTVLDDRVGRGQPTGIWSYTSVEEIEQEARTMVGPDGDGPEMETWFWAHRADLLGERGPSIDPRQLIGSHTTLELSEEVRARITSA